MEAISQADTEIFLWINGWVGTSAIFDRVAQWVVSDYLIPVTFSVVLLWLWFGWTDWAMRERHQRGVMLAGIGVGITSGLVKILNEFYFRSRPFESLDVEMLFYPPTDSSFPANPVAIVVAMATGAWMADRRIGAVMYICSLTYGFSRIYAGVFYPLDILGGALIGVLATYIVYLILKRIEPLPTLCLRLVRFLMIA